MGITDRSGICRSTLSQVIPRVWEIIIMGVPIEPSAMFGQIWESTIGLYEQKTQKPFEHLGENIFASTNLHLSRKIAKSTQTSVHVTPCMYIRTKR